MGILITGETWQRWGKNCKILIFHVVSWNDLHDWIQLKVSFSHSASYCSWLGSQTWGSYSYRPLDQVLDILYGGLGSAFDNNVLDMNCSYWLQGHQNTIMVDDVSTSQPPRPWVDGGEWGDEHWLCFSPVGCSWVACESKDCLNNFLGPTQQCRFDFHF